VLRPGQFYDGSDVNLGVEAIDSLKQIEAIVALSMAMLRDVDIVDLRQCHFAHRIQETGLLWTRDS
jgi:hypothetical protein